MKSSARLGLFLSLDGPSFEILLARKQDLVIIVVRWLGLLD